MLRGRTSRTTFWSVASVIVKVSDGMLAIADDVGVAFAADLLSCCCEREPPKNHVKGNYSLLPLIVR